MTSKRRVGIVGYGALGQFLVDAILSDPACSDKLELAFVWNRSPDRVRDDERIPREAVLESLDDFAAKGADLIVEVAHPDISRTHGAAFLRHADYMVGSPTAFADAEVERSLRAAAEDESTPFGMYIPSGALWGAKDIQKAAARGTVAFLSVTMKKHPSSLKVQGELQGRLDEAVRSGREGETVLYDGPVRGLCPLAPNNVNTMACAAMAAPSLGFDGTRAVLVCDPSLEAHVIDIEMRGPKKSDDEEPFSVATRRYNPAKPGAVTGSATYTSFLSSMLGAAGQSAGVHFC